jgi:diguanylate cyclase (GGDEF)-like protein/excisionase family DNA binding protein
MTIAGERAGPTWLRVADVAALMGVSANTVRRWTDAGRIAAHRSPGGHRRYLAADVTALMPGACEDGLGPQPGEYADLRRQTQDLRAVVHAGHDLAGLLSEAPWEVPEQVARRLCDLTETPRCDVLVRRGDRLSLVVSIEGGEPESSRTGESWSLDDWIPTDGAPETLSAVALPMKASSGSQRERRALQRRGCRSMVWAPMTVRGAFIGAVEISDARVRDLSEFVPTVVGLTDLCAHAVDVDATYRTLDHREKAIREIVELSQEVAEMPDLERFAERFSLRLMAVVNADCVDLYQVSGGVIRLLVDLTRDGVDTSRRGRILDTGQYPSLERTLIDLTPLVINDLSDRRLAAEEVERYRTWGYASSVTMPLVSAGTLVGLVDIYDDAERDWGREVEFLTGVTQLAAGLFDNAVLLDEVKSRSGQQQRLVELAASLSTGGPLGDLALEAAHHLREGTGVEDCDIWWLEEGYLHCLASLDGNGPDEAARGRILDLARHPSTRPLLERRETLLFASFADSRVTDGEREEWNAYGFLSSISVPLVAGDEVVGMIDLWDVRERDYNEVRSFLSNAAHTVADALQNSHLMESLRHSNAALGELVELSDRLNDEKSLEGLARVVAERLRAILAAEDCDIWAVEGDRMRCLASFDSGGWDETQVGIEHSVSSFETTVAALGTDEPVVVGDLEAAGLGAAELGAYRRWDYRSLVSLPLVVQGRPIGLVDVFDTTVRDYTGQLDFIRNVGRLLAGAFEKALLVERLESGNRDLRLLVDSGLEFGSTLDVDAVIAQVAERILTASRADMCDVYGVVGEDAEILVSVGDGAERTIRGTRYPMAEHSMFTKARATRRPVFVLDVHADPTTTAADRADAERWGYRTSMSVPFLAGGDLIGFIDLYNHEARPFVAVDTIVGLAQIAGQAVANARLYRELDESVRWMTLMSESALELSGSLDLRDTLLVTAKRLCQSVGVPECEITVIEGEGLRTLMRVDQGRVDEEWIGQYLSLADAAVTREVITTKRPTVVRSLRDARLTQRVHEINRDYAQKSWATLPLIVKDRVIGTVELVESGAERTFTDVELQTAAAICHAAAMAIENATLYEGQQTANQEAQLLNEIARRTAASLDLEEIVRAAVDELHKLMSFDTHSLFLAKDGRIERVISPDHLTDVMAGLTIGDLGEEFLDDLAEKRVLRLRLPQDVPLQADNPLVSDWRAAVAIALPSDTGIIGAFNLASHDPGAFEDLDAQLLERVATQLSLAIKNAQLYDEIKQMHLGNLKALSSALNAKDYYTLGHAARVAAYTVMLGERLGWTAEIMDSLEEAAYLHDIGKISISDRVLLKPGRLNPQEWQQMRLHPVFSADIIRPLFNEALVAGVRHHHERYDGNGYPEGIAGDDIPLLARGMAVVDAYDAMSCRRPYKAALTYSECLAELRHCRGTQFDPDMVDGFLEVLEDLARTRAQAEGVAIEAASRIPGEKHAALRGREDETTSEYGEISAILREVRDANPPTRFLTTHTQIDKKYVIGVDPEESEAEHSHFGDEIFADDELPQILEGRRPQVNTLFADQFGVWVTGLAPILDGSGRIVAAVAADLPALSRAETEVLRGESPQTFATMLQSAAVRLSRAEIDAITDALTGLYNHRYLHERLAEELHRAHETGRPLTVLFCDLDHFKGFNDANGHRAGDRVLREVSHIIEQSVRNIDIAGRYGGEEFVVILVETGRAAALTVAERIRERIRAAGFAAHGTPLTVSIGVAGYPEDADRREELLDKADWAMYLAKRRGRDQVASFSED